MPFCVYSPASSTFRCPLRSATPGRHWLPLLLAVLFAALHPAAGAQQIAAPARRVASPCGNEAAGQAVVRMQSRTALPVSLCEGRVLGGQLQSSSGDPVTLASADLDEDGVPDLISGFSTAKGGSLSVHRGNVHALWPYGTAAATGAPQAFFPESRTFALPASPDFLVTGDFDADGHWDVIVAQRNSSAMYFLKGDGHGSLLSPKKIDTSGAITALIAGDVNRPDGLADLALSISTAAGPRLLVYESPLGAVKAQPEIFNLAHPATALATGRFNGGGLVDLAVGAGNQLMVVHGRDRRLSVDAAQRAAVSPAKISVQELPYSITAITAGDFTGSGPGVAALGTDHRVHILEGQSTQAHTDAAVALPSIQAGPTASTGTTTPGASAKLQAIGRLGLAGVMAWSERSAVDLPAGFAQRTPQLLAARVAGSQQEDLLALDSGNRQMHVLSTGSAAKRVAHGTPGNFVSATSERPTMKLAASLQAQSSPAAVLPMRLGRHGLSGVVMMQEGSSSPVLMPQDVPPTNVFTVTNTLDIASVGGAAPAGSLRDAMNKVEAASGQNGGAYEIDFNIPTTDPGYNATTGTFLIKPLSENVPNSSDNFALPPINATVTIDGYTQPGASPNTLANGDNAKILIQIDGSSATTPGGSGFVPFDDVGSVFRGIDFTGWLTPSISGNTASGADGIEANGVGDFIEGNFFGTDPTGLVAAPNRLGIFADNGPLFGSAPGNIIGGTTPQARNILSGNNNSGILFLSTAYEAQLQGNFIGLDATGAAIVANPQQAGRSNIFDGAGLNGPTVTIGGTLPGATNYIAGNGTNVDINDLTNGGAAKNSTVQGNVIGTNAAATTGFASQGYGVSILHGVSNMTIGGTTPAARNLISGNLGGVYVFDNSFNNVIQGNYIGTDAAGTTAVANTTQGIIVGQTTSSAVPAGNTIIGGPVAGAGNLISGNTGDGISISGTSQPDSQSPYRGNIIQGNFIGTNAGGTAALGNGGNGVSLSSSATNNIIGGSGPGSANTISYNGGDGVHVDPGASGSGNQTVANTIQANTGAGVRIATGTGNRISQNSIFANQALGIDVDATGPNTNAHCNTPNSGANNLQNYPVLTAGTGPLFISATATDPNGNTSEFSRTVAAAQTGSLVSLLGSFDSTANTSFNIEFFSNSSADASGYGQGETYLGAATITTDANCGATISNPVDLTQADVSVQLVPPSDLEVGQDFGLHAYTAHVANNGAAVAHNVVLTDTLPAQLKVSSAYCNVASCQSPVVTSLGACTVSGQTVTCNLGTMAPGATAAITIPVQTLTAGSVSNTATVSASEADPNPANNTATTSTAATYPFPFLDHLAPTSALVNSGDLPLTIYGEQLVSNSMVTFNGTPVPVTGYLDNQVCGSQPSQEICAALQVVVPASLLGTAGTPVVEVTNPDPGEGGGANFPSDLNFTVASSCTYSVFSSIDSGNIEADGPGLIAEGVSVTTNVASCPWTASSSVPWAVIMDNASATGSGNADINIAPNTGSASRTGTVTVAGTTYTITQDGGSSCPNTLNPASATVSAAGGTGSTNVTTGSSCSYFVVPYADWITIPKSSGLLVGNATASYVVAANHGAPRTGAVALNGSTLTITQQSPTCYFTLDSTSAQIPTTGGTGTIAVTASSPSCAWTAASSNASQIAVTSGASGTGNGTVHYSVAANTGGPLAPTLTIGDGTGYTVFTANQASAFACTFTITPTPRTVSSLGTTDFFAITASFNFCKWTATSNDPTVLTINQNSSGMGSGSVFYSLAKNTSTTARVVTITAGCQTFTINQDGTLATNPVPAIGSLLPASATAGSAALTLTVNGSNFVNGSTVNFAGNARVTTYVSPTQLTAAIPATDLTTAGTFPVTVTNPTPGGGVSNAVDFTVTASTSTNNPVPAITALQPSSVTAGAGATTLTVTGTNFIASSVVSFNGAAKVTTFVSATKLTAALLASDVGSAGGFPVTVTNPAPGGGTSSPLNFTVNAASVPAPAVMLGPTALTFPSTSPTTTSAAQTVTLTNSGTATLHITGISITGSSASAFAETNTCGATLATSASCAISIVFTPPSPGSYTASLSVADDASGSPQAVSLSGTGSALPTFAVSSNTAAQTVTAGGSAQYTITVAAQNGTFPGAVTLAASGFPQGATASFSQTTVSPGSSSATSQLTITTAAPVTTAAGLAKGWPVLGALLPMLALFLSVRRRRLAWPQLAVVFLASLAAATALTGCGGGFGLGPAGKTYNVTVTATSGETQQTTTVQLIVK